MSFFLGICQIFLCLVILIYEYNKRSISMFFWSIILVIFCIPHLLETIFHLSVYNLNVINKSSLFVIGFELLYFVTRLILLKKGSYTSIPTKEEISKEISNESFFEKKLFRRMLKLSVIVLFVFILIFYITYGRFFNISWGEFYISSISASSTSQKILETVKSFNHLIFFAISGLFVVAFYKKKTVSSLFVIFLIGYYSLATKNRIAMLPFFVGILLILILNNKRLNFKQILKFTVIGIVSIYFVYGVWIFRHTGTIENFMKMYTFKSFNLAIFDSILNSEGELALRNIFYYFININNKFPGLGTGATYLRMALMLIPTRFCFGIKPSDFAITMSSAYMNNIYNTNYSVHPTFFGDLFANFNFFGVFMAIFWAFYFLILDKYIAKCSYIKKICLIVLWGSCLIIIGRGSVYNGNYIAIISTIILFLIERIWFVYGKKE